jgi:hypothetical protein
MQEHFELIPHLVEKEIIEQRVSDGYINATAMCKAAGRNWFDYRRQKTTDPYLNALASETGIPASELIQSLGVGLTRVAKEHGFIHKSRSILRNGCRLRVCGSG